MCGFVIHWKTKWNLTLNCHRNAFWVICWSKVGYPKTVMNCKRSKFGSNLFLYWNHPRRNWVHHNLFVHHNVLLQNIINFLKAKVCVYATNRREIELDMDSIPFQIKDCLAHYPHRVLLSEWQKIENWSIDEGPPQRPDMVPRDFFSRKHLESLFNVLFKSGKNVTVVFRLQVTFFLIKKIFGDNSGDQIGHPSVSWKHAYVVRWQKICSVAFCISN